MHYLVGTDTVHTTAAACDYLDERASADDRVTVVGVAPAGDEAARRDRREALNVAPVRLAGVGSVETELLDGEPAPTLVATAENRNVDELVVGVRGGRPGDATGSPVGGRTDEASSDREAGDDVGSTARALLASAGRPVVVLPAPDL